MMKNTIRILLASIFFLPFTSSAQQAATDIYKDMQRLGVLANVLYVAAHPDDENTRLISYLSNHLHVRTTYLSLTRGDGGQNLIGPEFREMLGVIRSHELLEARKIDGGHQLFTRANDFGYSKTPTETFNIWDRGQVLSDVIWAIRKTKPDVIINRFSTDTSRPNHGHHTASAILALEAFDLTAKKQVHPEHFPFAPVWQPRRIYYNTSWWFYGSREAFDKADKSRMISIDIGAFDPMSGESNSEIAGRSRSLHKSQGFGSAETRGESLEYLELLKDENGAVPASLFDGIDITWNRVAGGKKIGDMVAQLQQSFDFREPKKSVPQLLAIRDAILSIQDPFWKLIKLEEVETLIQKCLGLYIEIRTDKFRVIPGTQIPVTLEVINRSDVPATVVSLIPSSMDTTFELNQPLVFNIGQSKQFTFLVPDELSIPYWLDETPEAGMYKVSNQELIGQPANTPAMYAQVFIETGGHLMPFTVPLIYKTVDPAEGEISRPVSVTPPASVDIQAEALVFAQGQSRTIPIEITALQDSISGSLMLTAENASWTITPAVLNFSFSKSGETKTVSCTITPPNNTSLTTLIPEIKIGDHSFKHRINTLDYDHLPYMSIVRHAAVPLQSLDIKISDRPIGYIKGAGDEVAASLRQIGYRVDELNPDHITSTSLHPYQVILIGVRAYNTVEALAHKNQVLFDWVREGGTLITQYNVSRGLVTETVSPLPITLSRDRITEENSPVILLHPDHPVWSYPNKIEANDFNGWVQERGLYFPNKWDPAFRPLLEMHDSNEGATQGGLLVAPYGEGHFVYSGLSWFRHLPAGNPGAYRLLSNLISLGYKNRS